MIETIANKTGILKLVDALAIFIKQEYVKIKGVKNTFNKYYKNNNLIWVSKYSIQIYSFIAMWKTK